MQQAYRFIFISSYCFVPIMPAKLLFSLTKRDIINSTKEIAFVCYSSVLSSSTHFNAQAYHSNLIKDGSLGMLHVSNYLLSLYLKDYHLEFARKLFDEIPQRDVRTWTVLVSGLSRCGHHNTALDYFKNMQNERTVLPNAFTLSSVLKCCTSVDNGLQIGKAIHGWIMRNGVDADVALQNALLDLYAKFKMFDYVRRLFQSMDDKDCTSWNIVMAANLSKGEMQESLDFFWRLPIKSVSSWNTIIDGLLQQGFQRSALELLFEMVKMGHSFDRVTFSISLVLASSLKSLELGRQIHSQLLRIGINEDSFARTSLLDMYCKCGQMEKASVIFRELQLRHCKGSHDDLMAQTVGWSTTISGYVQHGMIKDALLCFNCMIHEQLEVDLFTLTTIVAASANTALFELGQQIHARTLKSGHGQDIMLCSSMIDMYAKCGKLDDAWSLFRETRSRNVVLWSVMISSYAMHGWGREAIELFELMQNEGIRPNEVSFVGLLTGCSHAGLIEDGCRYFRMMSDVYGIRPTVEHFACMVDIFGRAGHLKEMKDFVYENGILHLKEVWKTYLSSCWLHKNVEMTNWVSKKLVELEKDGDGDDSYVMISNTYAANNVWDEAAKHRGLMQERKVPGQSWIQGMYRNQQTMSVLAVMRNLKAEVDEGIIRPYCFVEINGLKLPSPETIYSVIYEGLSGHRVGWKKALHFLNERFSDETKHGKETKPCILLIDELDLLVTRNQSVLYNILDWPNKPNSKLIVIGIANTMDLPEKLLPRISSRMGIPRLCFGPYNYQQLQEIISSCLKGIDAFEKVAIEFASRKVAAVSGDARRALEICRCAAELADYRVKRSSLANSDAAGKITVGMTDVESAIKEMFQAPHIQVIRSSSKLSKIFLAAMVHELYKTGRVKQLSKSWQWHSHVSAQITEKHFQGTIHS